MYVEDFSKYPPVNFRGTLMDVALESFILVFDGLLFNEFEPIAVWAPQMHTFKWRLRPLMFFYNLVHLLLGVGCTTGLERRIALVLDNVHRLLLFLEETGVSVVETRTEVLGYSSFFCCFHIDDSHGFVSIIRLSPWFHK